MKDKKRRGVLEIEVLLGYANSIIATLREPFLVLDKNLRVISANQVFYTTFEVKENDTIGRPLPDLGDRQWNIPKLLQLLKEIIPEKKVVKDYEVEHKFEQIGERAMCLNARQLRVPKKIAATIAARIREEEEEEEEELILLAIEDITERKYLQIELKESEERYRRAFETSRDGLLLVHKTEADILNSNASAQELLGYSNNELLKKKLWEIGVVKDVLDFQATLSRLERDGVIHYGETPVKTKKGPSISTEIILVNKAKVIQCNIRDITERKRMADELAQAKEYQYRTLLESLPQKVFLKDRNSVYISCNENYARDLKIRPEEIVGKTDHDFFPAHLAEKYRADDKRIMESGKSESIEEEHMVIKDFLRGAQKVVVNTVKVPVLDKTGNVIGIFGIFWDITERKLAEEALRDSEERYRKIIGSITSYIYTVVLENGRPVRTTHNPECYAVTGYSPEEFDRDSYLWINMVFADDRHLVTAWVEDIIKGKKVGPVEHRIIRRDGSICWIRNTAVIHSNGTGKMVSYDGVVKDITDEIIAREEQARANALDMIIQGVPDAIMVTDIQGRISSVNRTFMDKFGYGKEVIGKAYADFGVEEDRPKIRKKIQECLEQGAIDSFECNMLCKDKREIAVLKDAKLLRDTQGNPQNIIVALTDITERKKAERTLLEATAMKANFTANVSHELRTPLGALKESIALMLEGLTGAISEEQKKYLNIAKQNVDRLARLINDVLDFQKLEAGKLVFHWAENDINKAIKEVYDTMLPLTRKQGLVFILKLDGGLPKIRFDRDRIIQVLTNLINNSLKITQKGGITVSSNAGNNNIQVSVQDTGSGIKEEDIPRLFRQFEQLGKKTGGTGLGLAISKDIIMAHGGKIWAESTIGQGTTVHFILPIIERRGGIRI